MVCGRLECGAGRWPATGERKAHHHLHARPKVARISSRTITRSTITQRFAPGTPDRATHLKDGEEFLQAIDAGTLPQVSFYKPTGRLNQHPAYTDLVSGDAHIADLLERLRSSPQWNDMVVIVTYDENGGFWDHVPPPPAPAGATAGGRARAFRR